VVVSYVAGHLLRILVGGRLARLAARTKADWDDALVAEVAKRVPLWAVLIGVYLTLGDWPVSVEHREFASRVIAAFGVLSVTFAASAVTTRLVSTYGFRAAPGVPVSGLSQNVVHGVVVGLGLLVVVRSFGYDITPYLTALGVGGLAVALAVQDPLSNFFAGVFMSVSGQVRISDYVKVDPGAEGYVADFNWRSTSIRTLGGNLVIVPNAKLAQATVTNYHHPTREVAVIVDLVVHYLSDLERVERVTVNVASEVMRDVDGGVKTFVPSVRFTTFAQASVNGIVTMRAREFSDQFLIAHEFIKRLHARFEAEGIVIPFAPVSPDAKARTPATGETK
jgi:small-conductance mechanosensitive channel